MLALFLHNLTLQSNLLSNNLVVRPVPAVQSPWLAALTLLGVPAVVIFTWVFEHMLFSAVTFGWAAFAELALPLGACIFATIVFLVPNPMHALLALLGVFFTTVLFYLAAGIEFVGLVFLIVYVGAVAILFLFVIMLLNVKSLTSKEPLLQHITQSAAIVGALVFFQQLYGRVLGTLAYALTGEHVRGASVESTTGDAILFYARYGAVDINRLTALYTFHSLNFLIITIILLVALMGAIILATVTTERATAVSDIRVYTDSPVTAFWPAVILMGPLYLTELPLDFLDFLLPGLKGSLGIIVIFLTPYLRKSRRNAMIFYKDNDYADSKELKRTPYFKLRRLVPLKTLAGVNKKARIATREPKRLPRVKNKKRWMRWIQEVFRKLPQQPHRKLFLFREHPPLLTSCADRRLKQMAKVVVAGRFVTNRVNDRYLRHSQRIITRSRWLWSWRGERALWLLRPQRVAIKYFGDQRSNRNKPQWKWKCTEVTDPFNIFTLGLLGWLRYLYLTKIFPFLYYWAWRARAFTGMLFLFMVAVPLVLVPIPWFLSDYDVVWHDLCKLHTNTYDYIGALRVLANYPAALKELLTLLWLYPAAAFNIVIAYPTEILTIAGLYAYDKVLFTGGDFARAELHDSTCNYFRILSDRTIAKRLAPTEATIAWRRRHPDRGRTDGFLYFWLEPTLYPPYFGPVEWVNRFYRWCLEVGCPWRPNSLRALINRYMPDIFEISGFWYVKRPFAVLALFLVPAALIYGISSIFILANWRRVYGSRSRPTFLWPLTVLIVALYVGVFWFNRAPVMHRIFYQVTEWARYSNVEDIRSFIFFLLLYLMPLLWYLIPYLFYRSYYFVKYQIFAVGNTRMFRRFVNYYLCTMQRLFYEISARSEAGAGASLAELEAEWAALQLRHKQLQEKKEAEARRPKYIHYKKVYKPHDPDPSVDKVPRSSSPAYSSDHPFIS